MKFLDMFAKALDFNLPPNWPPTLSYHFTASQPQKPIVSLYAHDTSEEIATAH